MRNREDFKVLNGQLVNFGIFKSLYNHISLIVSKQSKDQQVVVHKNYSLFPPINAIMLILISHVF